MTVQDQLQAELAALLEYSRVWFKRTWALLWHSGGWSGFSSAPAWAEPRKEGLSSWELEAFMDAENERHGKREAQGLSSEAWQPLRPQRAMQRSFFEAQGALLRQMGQVRQELIRLKRLMDE